MEKQYCFHKGKMMDKCLLCGTPKAGQVNELRTGDFVCDECIQTREQLLEQIEYDIELLKNKKPPVTVWNYL